MDTTSLVQDIMIAKLESDRAIKKAAFNALEGYMGSYIIMSTILMVEIAEIDRQLKKLE